MFIQIGDQLFGLFQKRGLDVGIVVRLNGGPHNSYPNRIETPFVVQIDHVGVGQ